MFKSIFFRTRVIWGRREAQVRGKSSPSQFLVRNRCRLRAGMLSGEEDVLLYARHVKFPSGLTSEGNWSSTRTFVISPSPSLNSEVMIGSSSLRERNILIFTNANHFPSPIRSSEIMETNQGHIMEEKAMLLWQITMADQIHDIHINIGIRGQNINVSWLSFSGYVQNLNDENKI